VRPNQALPEGIPLGQADGMSWVRNSWLVVGLSFYYYLFSTSLVGEYLIWLSARNLFRLVYFENYQCGSLTAIR
jgi:hypothetical protein